MVHFGLAQWTISVSEIIVGARSEAVLPMIHHRQEGCKIEAHDEVVPRTISMVKIIEVLSVLAYRKHRKFYTK